MTAETPVRRWTALGLFVVAPLVLVLLAAAGVAEALADRSEAARITEQAQRYRARLTDGGGQPAASADTGPLYVSAPSRSLAEADLQRRLVSIIEAASARVVESGSGLVPEVEAGDRIEIRATLDADNARLLRFLHAVEAGLPLMTVTDLAVRRLQAEDSDTGGNPELRIEVVVRAPWRLQIS